MSQKLVDLNPDLRRLRDVGYNVEVWEAEGHLVVRGIPYVTSAREIKFGVLVSELTMVGNLTRPPSTHVILFAGEFPCSPSGTHLEALRHQTQAQSIGRGLSVEHSFSNKPRPEGFQNYFEKITHYASVISHQAQAIDSSVTPMSFSPISGEKNDSVFQYIDTASSRAGISAINSKLAVGKVGIVGLGGTGSYVLDLIAKTPVGEIHLFDGDKFHQHNAFRAPGAPTLEELQGCASKVDYFANIYSRMHKGIVAHPVFIGKHELDSLCAMDFVFLCMDAGPSKKLIVERLSTGATQFIDVGMGIEVADDVLTGVTRVTTSIPGARKHVEARISFADINVEDAYRRNIQIADLNALNAALAVIQWKKLLGFYFDAAPRLNTVYSISGGELINDPVQKDVV
jgi:hypothetical protein